MKSLSWLSSLLLLSTMLSFAQNNTQNTSSKPPTLATSLPTVQPSSQPASIPTSQPASLPSWAPKLKAIVKPAIAKIGDPIMVSIDVRYKKGISASLPLQLELGDFSELSRDEDHQIKGAKGEIPDVEHRFELKIAAYKLGELELPPISILALNSGGELLTLKTQPLKILIKSVMANEPKPKLKKEAPPVSVFQRTWWLLYLLIGIAVVSLTILITLIIRKRIEERKKAALPPPPPIPPHIIAHKRLDELAVDQFIAEDNYKGLYLELSEIIREYVGGRYAFDALEMTSTEIRFALESLHIDDVLRKRLNRYFNECDLVKFAKYRPEDESARASYQEARSIVEDTTIVVLEKSDNEPSEMEISDEA